MSGSSLSDSCYSVSSDAAQGGSVPPARPLKLWEQVPLSADNTDILWSEGAVQPQQQPALQNSQEDAEPTEGAPVSGELVQTVDPCNPCLNCLHLTAAKQYSGNKHQWSS